MRLTMFLAAMVWLLATPLWAQEPIFSGPQPGEKVEPFEVQGVLGEQAGKKLDFVKEADGKPLVLIFVHEVNRPTIGFTRVLSNYSASRRRDGLHTGVIWLDDDATSAENTVKRVQHALTPQAPLGVSLDGREGPGSYGLNRNVALTILIVKENRVTANFALVQPSLQVDLPKVLDAIVKIVGGPVPKLDDVLASADAARPGAQKMNESPARSGQPNAINEQLRPYLRPIIQKDASESDVKAAIEKVEKFVSDNTDAKRELIRIAKTIVDSGKLENYGTPPARAFLEKWSKEK